VLGGVFSVAAFDGHGQDWCMAMRSCTISCIMVCIEKLPVASVISTRGPEVQAATKAQLNSVHSSVQKGAASGP